jgi:hypothetical protein
MKKFEPHYRLVRVGAAQKIEKASRQQRTCGLIYTAFSFLCACASKQSDLCTNLCSPPQGNNERTEQRNSGVQRRRRVHRRTRRNERVGSRVCGRTRGWQRAERLAGIRAGGLAILLCQYAVDSNLPPPPERHAVTLRQVSVIARSSATTHLPIRYH